MLEIDGIPYPVRFANFQRNSIAAAVIKASGRVAWAKPYSDTEDDLEAFPVGLNVGKDHIGVVSTDNILLFGPGGDYQRFIQIGDNSPVIFGKRGIAYADPAFMLEYREYGGKVVLESKDLPAAQEFGMIALLRPTWDDFIAAVQFTGGPERLPKTYDVYHMQVESSTRTWSIDGEGEIGPVLLSMDDDRVVMFRGGEATVLSASSGTEVVAFATGFRHIVSASINTRDEIATIGVRETDEETLVMLEIFSLEGESQWAMQLSNPTMSQPPPCGSDGRVFVVDEYVLKCIKDSEVMWEEQLPIAEYNWMTVDQEDKIAVVAGKQLMLFGADGTELFSIEITEENDDFEIAPAVDANGRILVAGQNSLYCIQ